MILLGYWYLFPAATSHANPEDTEASTPPVTVAHEKPGTARATQRAPAATSTQGNDPDTLEAQSSATPLRISPSATQQSTADRAHQSAPKFEPLSTRALIPLLLTHVRYHGTSLLATTLKGWVKQFLVPQQNIDLVVFYVSKGDRSAIIDLLGLKPTSPDPLVAALPNLYREPNAIFWSGQGPLSESALSINSTAEVTTAANGALPGEGQLDADAKPTESTPPSAPEWFLTPHDATLKIRLQYVQLNYPQYILDEPSILLNRTWMRCGCPPYCPALRATKEYVQGTRWYTHDLMKEPLLRRYRFWMKLDVDIWFYRPLTFNLVESMLVNAPSAAEGKSVETAVSRQTNFKPHYIFAHTGRKYNGAGCSNELHQAILQYCAANNITIVSRDEPWWKNDDDTYYSNFVVSSVEFHLSEKYLALAHYLNAYRNGFFRYRWTDQSLFHKVFGLFFGPKESSFCLDLSELRCLKKVRSPKAVFWHSKREMKRPDLKKCL